MGSMSNVTLNLTEESIAVLDRLVHKYRRSPSRSELLREILEKFMSAEARLVRKMRQFQELGRNK